ncbi:MAG: NUDIX domain-containing protein, partial [Lachnospiraceae bacterium]|nr:NUDIX domain-containing protein [Lachnospiraceae bacterium]
MGERQVISAEDTEVLFDGKFLRMVDLKYAPGKHYYDATRRTKEELVAVKPDEEFRTMLTDAVSCVVVLDMPGQEPRLLLSYEYRYPVGRFLLSVPAGLIDEKDKAEADPVTVTAAREIKEETGLDVAEGD